MTDRERIELAAKAAGHRCFIYVDGVLYLGGGLPGEAHLAWSPRDDDGDCARLEAALRLSLVWTEYMVRAETMPWGRNVSGMAVIEDHGGDRQAARRMATLRCAAEIGRTMP